MYSLLLAFLTTPRCRPVQPPVNGNTAPPVDARPGPRVLSSDEFRHWRELRELLQRSSPARDLFRNEWHREGARIGRDGPQGEQLSPRRRQNLPENEPSKRRKVVLACTGMVVAAAVVAIRRTESVDVAQDGPMENGSIGQLHGFAAHLVDGAVDTIFGASTVSLLSG